MKRIIVVLIIAVSMAACSNSVKQTNSDTDKAGEAESKSAQPAVSSDDMVFIPAGSYRIGNDKGIVNEQPAHDVQIGAFFIDISPVTVADFREFISQTGYQTDAAKYGDAGVFNFNTGQWELVKGANWEYPFGSSGAKAEDNHPVTQVSWTDAVAYASWAGKRLPTEVEWEVAAKSAQSPGTRFSWGNELLVNGKYQANVWQGDDVASGKTEDGYLFTSPVGVFGANKLGLTDMGGNVWNWCADVFRPYAGSPMQFAVSENVKVIRGGSFFFDQYGENSFTTTGRFFNSMDTSLFNTGFRCTRSAESN